MSSPDDAVEARPWRAGDGPKPRVWTWPPADRPALWVRISGVWRHASVMARQDWPDGRTAYQVLLNANGSTPMSHRTYWWPQDGVRVAHRSVAEPTTEAGRGGDMPRAPRLRMR